MTNAIVAQNYLSDCLCRVYNTCFVFIRLTGVRPSEFVWMMVVKEGGTGLKYIDDYFNLNMASASSFKPVYVFKKGYVCKPIYETQVPHC